jgi:uncharacterized protein (TIGR00299 family) protein
MTMGALLDAGADASLLGATVAALGLSGEVTVDVRREERGHLGGVRVDVRCARGPARDVPELRRTIAAATVPERVRRGALDALDRLVRAESAVHARPAEELHLHELGGADTLVDLVGAMWLLSSLELAEVYASPVPAPAGGLSAPGTLRVLEGTGAVLVPDDRRFELVTPTGAALMASLARFERPALVLERVGYGLGAREVAGNAVALWLGHRVPEAATVTVLESNIDDMPANQLAALAEDLMAAGALDVSIVPALMKKGRPGHLLRVVADPAAATALGRLVLERGTSMGVRLSRAERLLAGRRMIDVDTGAGRVRVKVKELDGRPVDVAPEYEDCRRLGGDVRRVMREAAEVARRELGL